MSDALNRKLAELLEPEPTWDEHRTANGIFISDGGMWWGETYGNADDACAFCACMATAAALFEAALPRIAELYGHSKVNVYLAVNQRNDGSWCATFPYGLINVTGIGKTRAEAERNAIAAALGVTEE